MAKLQLHLISDGILGHTDLTPIDLAIPEGEKQAIDTAVAVLDLADGVQDGKLSIQTTIKKVINLGFTRFTVNIPVTVELREVQ
jgi:hypothetical protein